MTQHGTDIFHNSAARGLGPPPPVALRRRIAPKWPTAARRAVASIA